MSGHLRDRETSSVKVSILSHFCLLASTMSVRNHVQMLNNRVAAWSGLSQPDPIDFDPEVLRDTSRSSNVRVTPLTLHSATRIQQLHDLLAICLAWVTHCVHRVHASATRDHEAYSVHACPARLPNNSIEVQDFLYVRDMFSARIIGC